MITNAGYKRLLNFLLWCIAFVIICVIGITNVFADTYGSFENITVKTLMYVSPDYANAPIEVPVNSSYNLNQVRQMDILVNNYSFTANTHYQLEFVLSDTTLQYANKFTVSGSNGESCVISYDLSLLTGYWLYFDFQCPHATNNITISVSNSNNSYLWDSGTTTIFSWERSQIRSSDTPLTGSGTDTDNIINNNNQNTQSIINNQNQNTQEQIESQKVCTYIDTSSISIQDKYLSGTGSLGSNTSMGITKFYSINSNSTILLVNTFNYSALNWCFYNINKSVISCDNPSNHSDNSSLSIPSNASFVRFTIYKPQNKPTFQLCQSGNQALNDNINGLNDSLNDDDTTGATSEASNFFNSFNTNTFGLTSIITAPLNLIQSLTSSTCIVLHLPLPYLNNKYLDLPCMTTIYQTHFGSFFTMYQTITYGIIAYWVCVRIFNQVKDFKNPEHDEIEVVDL